MPSPYPGRGQTKLMENKAMTNDYQYNSALVKEYKFYEKLAEKILNSVELSEKEIHEAKRYYERYYERYNISLITSSRLLKFEINDLPYEQFKVFEYLELYGYVKRKTEPEKKVSFWENTVLVNLILYCCLSFMFGIIFTISIINLQNKTEIVRPNK